MPDQPDDDALSEGHDVPEAGTDEQLSTGLPPRLERWRRRSATGAIMTGFAMGLQEVFEPERKGPSIVQETSGDPPEDLAVDAHLDPIPGRRTVVQLRPWLFGRTDGTDERDEPGGPTEAGRPDATSGDEPGAGR